MRGKLWAEQTRKRSDRIIPAHAGQTIDLLRAARHQPDHPRACGANRAVTFDATRGHGSSPRMRGKPPSEAMMTIALRIIPAHAGQTTGRG